jgi:hypothetical protein
MDGPIFAAGCRPARREQAEREQAGARRANCMLFSFYGKHSRRCVPRPDRFQGFTSYLRQETSKLVCGKLILKVLDSHPDGQALTSEIAREVALLDSAAREIFLPSPRSKAASSALDSSPFRGKGVWRISKEGRQYVRSANPRSDPATEGDPTHLTLGRGATGGKPDPSAQTSRRGLSPSAPPATVTAGTATAIIRVPRVVSYLL